MGQSPPSTAYSAIADRGLPFLQGTADFGPLHPNPRTFCALPPKTAAVGDVLFSVRAPVGEINVADQTYGIGRGLCAVRPRTVNGKFIWWALCEARHQLRMVTTGSTFAGVTIEDVRNLELAHPVASTQVSIAEYLERETARLDDVAGEMRNLLQLLEEKRRAFIAGAVTRGTDAAAPLRDCGVEWLGSIPTHWHTSRCAWLFRERDERGEPDLPLLEVSINSGVIVRELLDNRIERTATDFNSYKVARAGDIVFNKMRMWQGAVGTAPVNGLVSPDYVVAAMVGPLISAYAQLVMRSAAFSAECARRSHGIAWDRLRLYWEGFRDIVLPVPPPDEQLSILAAVARETKTLDEVSDATKESIDLLTVRRIALINDVVTGQSSLGRSS
jgi:type I restriction enzyme, S subunit